MPLKQTARAAAPNAGMKTISHIEGDLLLADWQVAQQVALATGTCLRAQLDRYGEGVGPPPSLQFQARCQDSFTRAGGALGRVLEHNWTLQRALPLL